MITGALPEERSAAGSLGRGLLLRYRVLAFTTAALLIVLVFVGIPLQVLAGRPQVVNDVGTLHGFLYIAYLFAAFQLTRRLRIPKWQMALVLLAGTVPFCAFVAERKMTRRFRALAGTATAPPGLPAGRGPAGRFRRRWLSRRALLLHLEVAVVAPGCALAGWWQATRALAGNELSWVYSVEWPVFALLAIAGWWFLVHEDPDAYRARKQRPASAGAGEGAAAAPTPVTVDPGTARLATRLAALVGLELVLGVAALALLPLERPSDLLPPKEAPLYLAHALLGALLLVGAVMLLLRVRSSARIARLSGWVGLVGVALAGAGGTLTVAHPLRVPGMVVMLLGTVVAGFGYLFPALEKAS